MPRNTFCLEEPLTYPFWKVDPYWFLVGVYLSELLKVQASGPKGNWNKQLGSTTKLWTWCHIDAILSAGGDFVPGKPNMSRLSVRIPEELNGWLDEKSNQTGIPKSTLIYLAIDQYRKQEDGFKQIPELMNLFQQANEKNDRE